ncbi:VOC family protein [Nocardioides sp. zg-536]|uniref:VOC family protein n=1 Tax=Nocardioides faecalis TaxID=2803858 RepID=A0A938Y345_9ACTN|nr:VOC family protein [Nocardioides faecalis]MBM9459108.1 VOC family protein [Nocardioides faecalis]MBS4753794.1 VOC family protein [Nocardioides faecalis]QVI57366.1 VOC family protein [Nocardioides faecalis]
MVSARAHLWFSNGKAGDAARFYEQHIPDSKVTNVVSAPGGLPHTEPGEFIVDFTVAGMPVTAINAGDEFTLSEAFSVYLTVEGQKEVDKYWDLLTADGGLEQPCGWCKDKFGVSWQIVPRELEELCGDMSTPANRRALDAMFTMTKIDIAAMRKAYDDA